MEVEFILYVADQERSRRFYEAVLGSAPTLHVPGMTEFDLGSCKLGLMPEANIAKIITPALCDPRGASGVPRCELYLLVEDAESLCERAVLAGARSVDALRPRAWGHRAAYFADPDGHVLALADSH